MMVIKAFEVVQRLTIYEIELFATARAGRCSLQTITKAQPFSSNIKPFGQGL